MSQLTPEDVAVVRELVELKRKVSSRARLEDPQSTLGSVFEAEAEVLEKVVQKPHFCFGGYALIEKEMKLAASALPDLVLDGHQADAMRYARRYRALETLMNACLNATLGAETGADPAEASDG